MEKTEMDSSRNNLEIIKELLLDEQKLVTYVSVAKELCIHVNEAKNILTQVLKEIREKSSMEYNVNYIISGLSGNNSAKIVICPEHELDTHKNSFNTVLYYHIYSISLSKGVDKAALVTLNKFDDFPLCPGLIRSTECSKRTSEDTENLKLKCQVQNNVETKEVKKENYVQKLTNGDGESVKIKSEEISPKKDKSSGSINKINGTKSKSIAGFFIKTNNATSKSNKTQDSQKQTSKTENKDLSSFLTKSNSFPEAKQNKSIKKEIHDENMDVDIENNEDTKKFIKKEKEQVTVDKKSKSLSQIKKNGKVDKKRKRVIQVSDSESDNDPFADDKPNGVDSDDEIPPTPVTNTIKITSGILNPKKKRKIVDKTYTDEEGYILTRKEEVYESCSDDEVLPESTMVKIEKENVQEANKVKIEISPKDKKANKVSKKKISPPQKGKQTTMMSFFKKI